MVRSHHARLTAALLGAALFGTTTFLAATPARADFTSIPLFGLFTTLSVAWGDFDNDGDLDLASTNNGNPKYVYVNNGDSTFTPTAPFGVLRPSFAGVWADVDNDGDLDFSESRSVGLNRLYLNEGAGVFTATSPFGPNQHHSIAHAWGDYDNDGDLDLAIGNGILGFAEQNLLYVNNGDGTFTEQAQFGVGQSSTLVWGDYDNDGDLDLAVGNGGFDGPGEQSMLYVNNGDATFTGQPQFGTDDAVCMAWGDADNDGDLDMAVGTFSEAQDYLYQNNGDGTFTALPRFGIRDTNTLSWGDFDNDGDLDMAAGHGDFTSADTNYLYINDGAANFTGVPQFGVASTDGVAWGDFDNDGDLDLATGNEHSPQTDSLFMNNEDDGDGFLVHLVGRFAQNGPGYSNRDGVGARVEVYEQGFLGNAAHRLGMREIEAHGGFSSQSAIDAHFGLPGRDTVDVRIIWPGSAGTRIVQSLPGVPTGQKITVVEAGAFTSVPGVGAGVPGLGAALRVSPNPMTTTAEFVLTSMVGTASSVRIFDASGRLVRSLEAPASTTRGAIRVPWDGRTESGSPAPAGVYFARVAPQTDVSPARLVLIR